MKLHKYLGISLAALTLGFSGCDEAKDSNIEPKIEQKAEKNPIRGYEPIPNGFRLNNLSHNQRSENVGLIYKISPDSETAEIAIFVSMRSRLFKIGLYDMNYKVGSGIFNVDRISNFSTLNDCESGSSSELCAPKYFEQANRYMEVYSKNLGFTKAERKWLRNNYKTSIFDN